MIANKILISTNICPFVWHKHKKLEHQQKIAITTTKNNDPVAHSETLLKDLGPCGDPPLLVHNLHHIY